MGRIAVMGAPLISVASISVALIVAACATTPMGRTQLRLVSDAQMAAMGSTAFAQLQQETPPTSDPKTSRYVDCVAEAITGTVAPGQTWEVRVFDAPEVNAFALPGGKVGVHTGLLKVAENPGQLATVIGHEVAHVVAGHSAARVSNELAAQLRVNVLGQTTGVDPQLIGLGANLLLLLPYSRADETEADVLGLQYMAKSGFDPREAPKLWVNMSKQGGAPHPYSSPPTPPTRPAFAICRTPCCRPSRCTKRRGRKAGNRSVDDTRGDRRGRTPVAAEAPIEASRHYADGAPRFSFPLYEGGG